MHVSLTTNQVDSPSIEAPLTQRFDLRSLFDPATCRQGEALFRKGRVRLVEGGSRNYVGNVADGRTHPVLASLNCEEGQLHAECQCSLLDDGDGQPCRHLWAALLAAEATGCLDAAVQIRGGTLQLWWSNGLEDSFCVDALESLSDRFGPPSGVMEGYSETTRPGFASPPEPRRGWEAVNHLLTKRRLPEVPASSPDGLLHLALDLPCSTDHELVGYLLRRQPKGRLTFHYLSSSDPAVQPRSGIDLELATRFVWFQSYGFHYYGFPSWNSRQLGSVGHSMVDSSRFVLKGPGTSELVRGLAEAGRLYVLEMAENGPSFRLVPLASGQFQLRIHVETSGAIAADLGSAGRRPREAERNTRGAYRVYGRLESPGGASAEGDPQRPLRIYDVGLVFTDDSVAAIPALHVEWLRALGSSEATALTLPADGLELFLDRYYSQSHPPPLTLPDALSLQEKHEVPTRSATIHGPDGSNHGLPVEVTFRYGGRELPCGAMGTHAVDLVARAMYVRDMQAELGAAAELEAIGLRPPTPTYEPTVPPGPWRVAARRVPELVLALLARGWEVAGERCRYRRLATFDVRVSSGIDWLELSGALHCEGGELPLGVVLRALRKKQRQGRFLELGDGVIGVLPEAWLARWEALARASSSAPGSDDAAPVRLPRAQVGAVMGLVEQADTSAVDEAFARLRASIASLATPQPARPGRTFRGKLRDYQASGLGWLRWLETMGFGGCLADDMGLGKTVQVLAQLAGRARSKGPSLVVAPRSVLANWQEEAARFVPSLSVTVHLGPTRAREAKTLANAGLILTSHATLVRDVKLLSELEFDYIVLDEAQAIKNESTATARAARAIRARNRLALTGTPVENHLGELWSILEFTNPGLGHRLPISSSATKDPESMALLRGTLKPFIVRRTKREVASDLPERIEQTIHVDLDDWERRFYTELASHYQARVTEALERFGVERSTPQLLEALLRLRQAACHPGLIDDSLADAVSSKLGVLLARLRDSQVEGHKCLVFSQFTSHLDLVEHQLARAGIPFVRLDGKTRDRAAVVRRFQEDPAVVVFLISLKAGGTGLNLTAAEYVFLLDPWWNPAAEAQAIDRAHRIGQDRTVVAYRLIARGTIEEKVATLQAAKRALAESVLGDDAALLGKLTRDDLLRLLQ